MNFSYMGWLILQVFAAALATVTFSLLFGVHPRYYLYCGFIGGIGWLFYLLIHRAASAPLATFISTVIVILMSRRAAVCRHCPVTMSAVN